MAEDVVRVGEKHPDGATIEQVEAALDIPRRTLQRRLTELVSAGRLQAIGRAKQRRYHVAAVTEARLEELTASRAGQPVRDLVRRPLMQRTPVGSNGAIRAADLYGQQTVNASTFNDQVHEAKNDLARSTYLADRAALTMVHRHHVLPERDAARLIAGSLVLEYDDDGESWWEAHPLSWHLLR